LARPDGADAIPAHIWWDGFIGVAPGIGVIMCMPVSVCHHVSAIGQRSWPITS
jgi:hypothetical protein